MKMTPFFLWPDPKFSSSSFLSTASAGDVEKEFLNIYKGAEPVIFSSARASISAILELLHMGRADKVWCPPFSSHCVLETISRVATPGSDINECDAAIIYHQWGYIHKATIKPVCMEDAADSLLLPGNIHFPNGGKFQIVSLPKIYGCIGGGIVFCKEGTDANQLRKIRDTRKNHSWLQFFLKLSGRFSDTALTYWNGTEAGGGRPASPVCCDILRKIERTDKLVQDLREKSDLLRSIAPGWLQFPSDRLPCAVPVEWDKVRVLPLQIKGRIISLRHFNREQDQQTDTLVKVFPLPVHKDFSLADIEVLKKEME